LLNKKSKILILIFILLFILIVLLAYINKDNNKEDVPDEVKIDKPNDLIEITPNQYNKYIISTIPEERILVYIFNNYKDQELYEVEAAFENLDKSYRNLKFDDNFKNFSTYLQNKKNQIRKSSISSYSVSEYDDYKQYIIQDEFDNYYIFNETATMKYTVLLDTYTIDLPQFIEKYEKATTEEKVALNIDKIKQAINSGDYNYVYSKLNTTFKNNNYETVEKLGKYFKNELPDNINIEYKDFTNKGETYIYNIVITDLLGESSDSVNMQILMKLKDNRDYEISFSIK